MIRRCAKVGLSVNGHGGNSPVTALLHELVNDLPTLRVDWYSWWIAPSVTAVAESAGLKSNHAAWIEAFPFCRVAELPPGEKTPITAPRILNGNETRALYGDGVFGGPYSADDEVMQKILNAAVGDIIEKLKFG
jgi:creatinine amidohydrolase